MLIFCEKANDDLSFTAGVVPEGSDTMAITQVPSATVGPVVNSLESVLRVRLGNKFKTCCYVMSPKGLLASLVFNSIWVMLMAIITNGSTRKIRSPCKEQGNDCTLHSECPMRGWEAQLWLKALCEVLNSFSNGFVESYFMGINVFSLFFSVLWFCH